MKKDRQFILNSIKMDLYRVVTAAGDITRELPVSSVKIFLDHADKDFAKLNLSPHEKELRNYLKKLASKMSSLSDPNKRLRWTEDVMTTRCRL